MADNPITTPLPADLPTDWVYGQTIGPQGTDVGLTQQHGYNYLMQQVNAAQQAATQIGQAFSGLPTLGSDGKIPASQLPAMNYDPAGSAAAVQTNLTNHINNKNNPHGVTPGQIGAIPSSGGSVSGPLNFANSAWNNVGDDAAFGDRNVAGNFCVKGLNGAPGITLFTSDESQSYQVFGQHNLSLLMSQLSANSVCRIASGSYVGNGLFGESNPTVLQFPFKPKYVTIPTSVDTSNNGFLELISVYNAAGNPILAVDSVPTGYEYSPSDDRISGPLGYYTRYRYDNNTNTLYFYSKSSGGAGHQKNAAGVTYYWIAIG